jgi:serine/threonine protein phosphatase PrpC
MSGGAEAAGFVVNQIKSFVETASLDGEILKNILTSLDRKMSFAKASGETTCVVVVVSEEKISGASVGDSGAWLISDSGVEDLTANQVRKPLLGSGRALPVAFAREKFRGTLLIASDGLLKYSSREKIASLAVAPDLQLAAQELLISVRYSSGAFPDDVSVILVRNQ